LVTEVNIEDYKLPQYYVLSNSLEVLLYSNHEIRASKHGLAYFCPNIYYMGRSIDKYLAEPYINLLEPFEISEQIFNELGFNVEISDKGNFERECIDKFGSLENIANFFINEKYCALFDQFVRKKKKNNREDQNEGLYLKDRRIYMDITSIKMVTGDEMESIKFINEFIEKGIFQRFFVFKCERCRYSAWYDVNSVDNKFKCKACGKLQYYKSNHLIPNEGDTEPIWFYKLDEIVYKGYDNDMIVPILTLNKLKSLSKESFLFANEIEIRKDKHSEKPDIELDIFCILDGKIIIGECKKPNKIDKDNYKEIQILKRYKFFYKKIGAMN